MPKFNANDYLPVESYKEASDISNIVTKVLLLEFAREEPNLRNTIIHNFIARADMITQAVFQLWELQDYQDCWVLNRCLLDRLFHLRHLQQNDEFEVFEKWSFLEQYNAINRVRSDPEFRGSLKSKFFNPTTEQKERARGLAKNPPVWQRPKAEDAAKGLDMRFLYCYGYDFASTLVHPMANDGQQDFYTITKLKPSPNFPDHRVVLSNTLLITKTLIQEGLNASTLSWHALVYDFLDDFRHFLDDGSKEYAISFRKIGTLFGQGTRLCRPSVNP